MKFDFTKNIYLYKGRCDLYVFGDEAGFEIVVNREATIIEKENKPYGKNYNFIKNEVRHDILNDFECGWSDRTEMISRDVSFSEVRFK